MSEDVLQKCVDVRPGLVHNRVTKRNYEAEKKHRYANERSRTKPRAQLEAQKREEGLSCPIASDNKGFAMLQKMGYKPGQSLGKRSAEGLKEPISISVKSDRTGLGRDEFIQRRLEDLRTRKRSKKVKLTSEIQEEYLKHLRDKFTEKQVRGDLMKSQKACEQLDQNMDVSVPTEKWFWFSTSIEDKEDKDDNDGSSDDDDDEASEFEPSEMLEVLTSYLRKIHKYCIWCGTSYDDEDDLQSNCPGNTADDH